jgi:hypothetical protein
MPRALLPAVLSLSILLSTLVAAQDASYTFTTIDVPNASRTQALGINDFGQIVGFYGDLSGHHGYLYAAGVFTPIDVPFSDAAPDSSDDPLRTRTILPITPPFPSNSCACLASTSGNRCAISGLIFCC